MNLDATTKSLEVKISGNVTMNQLTWAAHYTDINQSSIAVTSISEVDGLTNNGTAVTMVAAPAANVTRQIKEITVENTDTVTQTVTVQINDTGTKQPIVVISLLAGSTLQFSGAWSILPTPSVVGPAGPQGIPGAGLVFDIDAGDAEPTFTSVNLKQIGSTFTPGSIIFASSSGALGEDNSNLFYDATGHNVGIGTSSPNVQGANPTVRVLTVQGDGSLTNSGGRIELVNPRANVSLAAGDDCGRIGWTMKNNSGNNQIAQYLGLLEGSGGANGFGGAIVFQTKQDNSVNFREVARFQNTGALLMASGNQILVPDASNTTPAISFSSDATNNESGLFKPTTAYLGFSAGALGVATVHNDGGSTYGIRVRSDAQISFSSTTALTASSDVLLRRDAANVLALKNSTNNQTYRAYDASGSGFSDYAGSGVIRYKNIATAGWGVPAIYGSGRVTAQTGAVASIAAYTVGGADGSFLVSANINVTTSTTHSFTVTVTYTDETNTSRTLTLTFSQTSGTFITTITNALGTGAYEGVPLHIRCKASTSITIGTTGTFTSVTYNGEGAITQIT